MRGLQSTGAEVVQFAEVAQHKRSQRELRAEAHGLLGRHGPNAYSEFLLKHGCRPSSDQAATMGRLMGARVRAADGTLQPPQTKTGRAARSKAKLAQQTDKDYIDQILRFRCALASLAENDGDPAEVIRYMDPLFGDAVAIREQLAHAVHWINRFAEEWGREQETHGGPRRI